jgi:hypothetical protein
LPVINITILNLFESFGIKGPKSWIKVWAPLDINNFFTVLPVPTKYHE